MVFGRLRRHRPLQAEGRWEEAGDVLADEARALVAAGAELLLLCTNTMHKVAAQIQDAVDIPLLHIADVTAAAAPPRGTDRLGLLGDRVHHGAAVPP